MCFYSIVPEDIIFSKNIEKDIINNLVNKKTISYNGKNVEVSIGKDGNYVIEKLISTDPRDFLDQKFFPGNIIKIKSAGLLT